MTLKQLTYFLEIAKMKNFTKAAANLYISQSALSKTVKAMESELGVNLIDRTVNARRRDTLSKRSYIP